VHQVQRLVEVSFEHDASRFPKGFQRYTGVEVDDAISDGTKRVGSYQISSIKAGQDLYSHLSVDTDGSATLIVIGSNREAWRTRLRKERLPDFGALPFIGLQLRIRRQRLCLDLTIVYCVDNLAESCIS
jgi:hypothetical protein